MFSSAVIARDGPTRRQSCDKARRQDATEPAERRPTKRVLGKVGEALVGEPGEKRMMRRLVRAHAADERQKGEIVEQRYMWVSLFGRCKPATGAEDR